LPVNANGEVRLRSPEWRVVCYDRYDPRRPRRPAATTAVFLRVHARNRELLERHRPVRLPRLPGSGGRAGRGRRDTTGSPR
ncbi:MAG: hypothetical protein ACE5G2_08775, partial [Candidatus Krumholzibacteriia bacterium]